MRISTDSCERIKELGFKASGRIAMYGERFEMVSDPFDEGDCIAVRATSGSDPEIRTLRLPASILLSRTDRFVNRPVLSQKSPHNPDVLPPRKVTRPHIHDNHLPSVSVKENHDGDN